MTDADHLTWERLIDLLESGSPDLGDHVRVCGSCRHLATEARRMLSALDLCRADVPLAWIDRAWKRIASTTGPLAAIYARLLSSPGRLAPALRGSLAAVPQIFLYGAGSYRISLTRRLAEGTTDPSAGGTLEGQLIGSQPRPSSMRGKVFLHSGNTEIAVAEVTETGGFRLEIPDGAADAWLSIEVGGTVIRVSPLPASPEM